MSAERAPRRAPGFTLMETLVVAAICAGLVVLMTVLYRSVAGSALALRAGPQEWLVQRQLREQLQHLFLAPKMSVKALSGEARELVFCSWQSRAEGLNGKPALVSFRFDAGARTLFYHELPLPAWWSDRTDAWRPERLLETVRAARAIKLLTAVDDVRFVFLAAGADPRPESWASEWREERPPRLVQMTFTRSGRTYSIWFETLATEA